MIDLAGVQKLSPQDGDVFVLPDEFDQATAMQFAEALHLANGVRCLILRGEVQLLDETAMNAAGWYRK